MSSHLGYVLYYTFIMIAEYLLMDILEFRHHATNQTNPTQSPAGVIKISNKEARQKMMMEHMDMDAQNIIKIPAGGLYILCYLLYLVVICSLAK